MTFSKSDFALLIVFNPMLTDIQNKHKLIFYSGIIRGEQAPQTMTNREGS